MRSSPLPRIPVVLLAAGCAFLASCGTAASSAAGSAGAGSVIQVVAAENFWGSIASQIGGRHVHVISIITNPNADPHSYEPTTADARTIAGAQLVIQNGIGYDPWAARLLGIGQDQRDRPRRRHPAWRAGRRKPAPLVQPGRRARRHRQITADLSKLDPAAKSYFANQQTRFDTVAMRRYHALIAAIKARYSGTPVGASESIFAMLAPALGLKLITPYSFLKAISEGTDVTAADKLTIDSQISHHLIKVYVYNSQNVTPDVQAPLAEVKAQHIPTATITETLVPASATYQAWQVRELRGIQAALAKATATGR